MTSQQPSPPHPQPLKKIYLQHRSQPEAEKLVENGQNKVLLKPVVDLRDGNTNAGYRIMSEL